MFSKDFVFSHVVILSRWLLEFVKIITSTFKNKKIITIFEIIKNYFR